MSGDQTKVEYAILEQGHVDIKTSWGRISTQLNDLTTFIKNFQSQWSGDASAAYHGQQAIIDQKFDDMANILNAIGTSVSSANDNYKDVERANTNTFS
jgi:WXG100 family type VII secretion target